MVLKLARIKQKEPQYFQNAIIGTKWCLLKLAVTNMMNVIEIMLLCVTKNLKKALDKKLRNTSYIDKKKLIDISESSETVPIYNK